MNIYQFDRPLREQIYDQLHWQLDWRLNFQFNGAEIGGPLDRLTEQLRTLLWEEPQ